jgi:hypothetical protein
MLCIFQNSPTFMQYIVTELTVNVRVHLEMYKRVRENKIKVYFRETINEDLC